MENEVRQWKEENGKKKEKRDKRKKRGKGIEEKENVRKK